MRQRIYVLICVIVLCSITGAALWLLSGEEFDSVPSIKGDRYEYTIHRTELNPREEISSFVVDNDRIYVHYDEAALTNVYTKDGIFEFGIQISTIPNGKGDIAVQNGKLYLKSRMATVFVFHEDQLNEILESCETSNDYEMVLDVFSLEKNTIVGDCKYQLSERRNDIVRQDTQMPVLDLPQRSYLAEHLLIICLIILAINLEIYRKLFHN